MEITELFMVQLIVKMFLNRIVLKVVRILAENYNPEAFLDNETCEYVLGCTEPNAINTIIATQNDGTCISQRNIQLTVLIMLLNRQQPSIIPPTSHRYMEYNNRFKCWMEYVWLWLSNFNRCC